MIGTDLHAEPRPEKRIAGLSDRVLREAVLTRLAGLRGGQLSIEDPWGTVVLGAATGALPVHAAIRVYDARAYRAIAWSGSVGAAESYIDGCWGCDELVALVRLLVRNRDLLDSMERGAARLRGWAMRVWHVLKRNTRRGSRGNIAAHYDLGNEFFSLFLSDDLMYSSALWGGPDDTLERASTRKLDVICRKLRLAPGDRVVEIGTGWGGFALHAATHYGCRVTTATISREQYALASERVARAGLSERIRVLLTDYRELTGQYEKLASIEMIEAVGAEYLDTYFGKLSALLAPGGLALIQAITIEDHRYRQALHSVDFIKRHIFPGSFIPSIRAMLEAKCRASRLNLIECRDFGLSYARTLESWRERFNAHLPRVRALGFDERFVRLWNFYLAYCEGGFREKAIGVAHLLLEQAAQP
ncbi:MAG TPA: cyclopropane-fatty-acyl-phospholipid synthase family protein [Steroidobacteraceae bacterium]|nr:cyclopropane-fatty-acyl-phospholipid synthase family protein [Steroidobacteraceae bacterium]